MPPTFIYSRDTDLTSALKKALSTAKLGAPTVTRDLSDLGTRLDGSSGPRLVLLSTGTLMEDGLDGLSDLQKTLGSVGDDVLVILVLKPEHLVERTQLLELLGIKKSVTHSGSDELLARKLASAVPESHGGTGTSATPRAASQSSDAIRPMRQRSAVASSAEPSGEAPKSGIRKVKRKIRPLAKKVRRAPRRPSSDGDGRGSGVMRKPPRLPPRRRASTSSASKTADASSTSGSHPRPRADSSSESHEPPPSPANQSQDELPLPGRTAELTSMPSPTEQPVTAADFFAKGQEFLEAGRHAHAHQAFAIAAKKEPDNPEYAAVKAWVMYLTDNDVLEDARSALRELAEGERDEAIWGNLMLGRLEAELGRKSHAKKCFETVLSWDAEHAEAKEALAAISSGRTPAKGGLFGKLFGKK